MELKDTIEMMNSPDYKERFKAEYLQLKLRADKLHDMLLKYFDGKLDFTPKCSKELLATQYQLMAAYQSILLERARIEGIDLKGE